MVVNNVCRPRTKGNSTHTHEGIVTKSLLAMTTESSKNRQNKNLQKATLLQLVLKLALVHTRTQWTNKLCTISYKLCVEH